MEKYYEQVITYVKDLIEIRNKGQIGLEDYAGKNWTWSEILGELEKRTAEGEFFYKVLETYMLDNSLIKKEKPKQDAKAKRLELLREVGRIQRSR